MFQRIRIGRHERGLLFRSNEFLSALDPGVHWVWGFGRHVERVSTESIEFCHEHLDAALEDEALTKDLLLADLSDDERGLLFVDGRVCAVLGPGRRAFWKGLRKVELKVFGIKPQRFTHPLLARILELDRGVHLQDLSVPKGARGMLFIDERLEQALQPGRYAFWKGGARVSVHSVEVREREVEVSGQEILTQDKVSLRINLTASYRVTEPKRWIEAHQDAASALYRELQFALREQVGTKTLDQLLGAKDALGQTVRGLCEPRAQALGAQLGTVGVRDVILPGDMKLLLNQVIEAEKRAKANLIQRREETAATRSLLNTAKLIESSPTLLRLKELEAAERIAESIDSVQVVGNGLEGLLQQFLPASREAS